MTYEAAALSIAKEAIKPTSGVIDALLAPKFKRLRTWAADRDLKARLEDPRLEIAFTTYLRRLLQRVSGITTLVFPQQVLALPTIYEPLHLRERKFDAEFVQSFGRTKDDIIMDHEERRVNESVITRPRRRTYIVDSAGMGKSTFARHIVMQELITRERIPIFLELRRVSTDISLIEALAADLDEFHRPFERDMFYRLLSGGVF